MIEELEERRLVRLVDEDSGETLEMEVFLEIELEETGKTYALLTPAAPIVKILRADPADEDVLEEVEPEEYSPLAKQFDEALRDWGVKLELRASEVVMVGEPKEELYEDCELLEVDTDEGPDELVVLIQIETGEANYLVCEPTQPDLYPVELDGASGRGLSDAELAELDEIFRAALEHVGGDDEDEAEE